MRTYKLTEKEAKTVARRVFEWFKIDDKERFDWLVDLIRKDPIGAASYIDGTMLNYFCATKTERGSDLWRSGWLLLDYTDRELRDMTLFCAKQRAYIRKEQML